MMNEAVYGVVLFSSALVLVDSIPPMNMVGAISIGISLFLTLYAGWGVLKPIWKRIR